MTPKTQAEMTRKCYRLFYKKASGQVIGVASGGGAIDGLSGDALILASYSFTDAAGNWVDPLTLVGCIERFHYPISREKPGQINLLKVADWQAAVTEFCECREHSPATHTDAERDAAAQNLMDARDACLTCQPNRDYTEE